jgi:hypothetical protein
MSAASPATSQARRTEAAAPSRSVQHAQQPPRQPSAAAHVFAFAAPSANDEIRLNLGDIPLMSLKDTMDVEGFKPSLLSRLLDLVAPLNKR